MMAQVLSPILSRESSIRAPQPLSLQLNTAFQPVDKNGSFVTDRIYKEGWLMKRSRKTKVGITISVANTILEVTSN